MRINKLARSASDEAVKVLMQEFIFDNHDLDMLEQNLILTIEEFLFSNEQETKKKKAPPVKNKMLPPLKNKKEK